MVNSKAKGARGERELSSKLKEYGYNTRRGQDGKFIGEPNKYMCEKGSTVCDIHSNNNKIATIDINDFLKIEGMNWYVGSNGYVYDTKSMKLLHRIIMDAQENEIIDHINRDKSDCRKVNLRRCTKSENAYNSKVKANNTSMVTGVWFRKDTGKWVAEIKHNYKKINLGCYTNMEDAIKARKEAELIYCKDFAPKEVQNG